MRLAVALRVLFHNTSASHALLHQMGLESSVKFLDSAIVGGTDIYFGHLVAQIEYETPYGIRGLAPSGQDGLVEVVPREDAGGRIVAPLRRRGHEKLVSFDEWWKTEVIDTAAGQKLFSRKQLVWIMANKDGGAHVDPKGPPDDYVGFAATGHGILYSNNTSFTNMRPFAGNAAAESVRQVAWEVMETFDTDPAIQAWLAVN